MSKRIIIYDDDEIMYETGEVTNRVLFADNCPIDVTDIDSPYRNAIQGIVNATIYIDVDNYKRDETIKLDETMMKRIAKFNKEKEIKKIDEEIKNKKKQLEELEEKIEDRQERWKKIQEFVAGIYDLDLVDDEDDYDDYD